MSEARKVAPDTYDRPAVNPAIVWLMMAAAFIATFLIIRRVSTQPSRGGKAEYNWTLTTLSGQSVPLSNYKGRPIFLNIWATWCGPCMREMPSIAQLASNPSLSKVAFLCVATDESSEPVKKFAAEMNPPMTILHDPWAPPSVFRTEGIPATFIIAPNGRIVRSIVGSDDWNRPEVVRLLEELAAEAK